jgi:uncharacterized protein
MLVTTSIIEQVAQELNLQVGQVQKAVELLDDKNTIPFIARYRKEATGGLDEVQLAAVEERVTYLRNLMARKDEVIRSIDEQGKLTDELKGKIEKAKTLQEVEDLYLPYRPKRRTRASIAREKGLQPLADLILGQAAAAESREQIASPFFSTEFELESAEAIFAGARDIVSETISENAEVRKDLREQFLREGTMGAKLADQSKDPGKKYEMYYEYSEPLAKMPPLLPLMAVFPPRLPYPSS